ncbi:MAG: hypothetical protein KDA68_18855, partial [Planctomycetaceae bacterium]|nr:hypothetical protein [Planctomycetaceae bacterium]
RVDSLTNNSTRNIRLHATDPTKVFTEAADVWHGYGRDINTGLALIGNRWYAPELGPFLSQGAPSLGSSPYTLGGNDPLNRGSNFDWESIQGPDAYANDWQRSIGSTLHSIVGDRLAYASDTQLFLGTALFSTGVAIVGKLALPYVAAFARAVAPAVPYIVYANTAFNGARVLGSGFRNGKLDFAADLVGIGLLSKARAATGLARTLLYAADAGINVAQGSRDAWESGRSFSNGDYFGGTLNALGAGLSFAGAFGSSAKLWSSHIAIRSYSIVTRDGSYSRNVSWFDLDEVLDNMRSSAIGRKVLNAAESHMFRLEFTRSYFRKGLFSQEFTDILGVAFNRKAKVFLPAVQTNKSAASVAIHEGVHMLGVRGSIRAEVLARIAEVQHSGSEVTLSIVKKIYKEVRSIKSYQNLKNKIGSQSELFPGITF